jgi:hypothetical protein
MKRLLFASAILLLASCSSAKSDVEVITDFYKAVLGETPMTDEILKESLSQDVLDAPWNSSSWTITIAITLSSFRNTSYNACQDGAPQPLSSGLANWACIFTENDYFCTRTNIV